MRRSADSDDNDMELISSMGWTDRQKREVTYRP